MIEEVSAGAVVFRETSKEKLFLLLHYPSGHWDFVKGKMEEGENPYQTVIREAEEETGLTDLEFEKDFENKIKYNFQFEGELVNKTVIYFLANTNTEKIKISHEHLDFIWLPFDEAIKKTTYENAKDLLKKASLQLS